MSVGSGELLDQGLDFVSVVVTRLADDDWTRPTPCAGWDARDLLGHLATSVNVAISIMEGTQPVWPDVTRPGDLVHDDPVAFWHGTATQAQDALGKANLADKLDSPLGSTVADALAIPVIDLYIHAWDLGVVLGVTIDIPADVIDYAHKHLDPVPDEMLRGPDRAFGPKIQPPAGATPTEQLIAWTGRRLPQ